MTRELLSCIEIEPATKAQYSVVWLHGLGADGHDFEPIVPHLEMGDRPVRFVFPHAPRIPVTINMHMVMPAWYDILTMDLKRRVDEDGVRASAQRITDLLARENERGVPCNRIVLAGFSQGGAIALHVGLRHPEALAGILALSTYLVCEEALEDERAEANQSTPLFQAHGSQDPMVPVSRGQAAYERLKGLGYATEFHDYPIQHEVCLEEIQAVGAWLRARFDGAA